MSINVVRRDVDVDAERMPQEEKDESFVRIVLLFRHSVVGGS